MRFSFTIFLGILALTLSGLSVLFMGSEYRNAIFGVTPVSVGQKLFQLDELDKAKQITITNSDGDKVSFAIDANRWVATEPWRDRADPIYIKFLFQFTASLQAEEVIPRKELDLNEFGLRDGNVRVTMLNKSGAAVCDYHIGRPTAWHAPTADGKATQPTVFIRFADDELKDKIYICSEKAADSIHTLFQNQFARFRDHHPFHFSPKYLDSVRIQNTEGEVVISRKNLKSGWSITKPLELAVDPAALSTLFENLAKLIATKVEDRASVTLPSGEDDTDQAREISIHFADIEDETVLSIYPTINEDDATVLATVSDRPDAAFHLPLTAAGAITNTTSLSQLQMGVNDLRSKTMTQLNGPQLKIITLRPEGRSPIMLQRSKKTTWRVLRPKGWEKANQDAVINLMTALTRDHIQKFITDAASDLTPYGLHQPFLQIQFISFNNEDMRVAFGRDAGNENIFAHIVGRPNIWQISSESLGKIAQNSWQWRTSHVWHIPKVDVRKITIHKNGQSDIELSYDHFTANWTAKQNDAIATASLNPNRADKFLANLESLQTKHWIGPMHPQAMKALENPDIIISMNMHRTDKNGQDMPPILKTLRIAHTPGGFINFAKVDTLPPSPDTGDESSYFLLSPETVESLSNNLFE